MVAEGYKNTEIGVIPEDWEIDEVGNVISILTDFTANGSFASLAENVHYLTKPNYARLVRLTDIRANFANDGIYITKEAYCFLEKSKLFGNELLVANVGANTGYSFKFPSGLSFKASLGPNMFLLRFNEKIINPNFSFYAFNSSYLLDQLFSKASSSAQPKLNKQNVRECLICYPKKLPEQLAIATVLSDADALISATEKLIAKKKAIKQGAMQELLKPKEGWKEKTIEEEFEILRGRDLSKSDLDEYGKFNCILYGELFTTYNEVINNIKSKTNNKGGTKSKYGDILFPSSTTTIGIDLAKCSTLLLDNVSLGGDVIILRKKHNNVNPEFISYYLNIICKHAIAEKTKGVTIYHLHGKDLIAIQISYPSLNEQTRIATILSDMDAEISLLEKRLEKQKHIKQGMMQNLLTGKTRLVESVRKEVKKPKHNTQINEAVVISFLVYKFGTEQYPLSRFRYTKYSYLLHRQSEKEAFGFDKYAAGPYNPANRYKGAEGIALKNKYITKVQNPKSKKDAFVINENIDDALNYFNEWYGTDIQQWIEQFRFYKNNYLEVLTTVDKAICELVSQKAPVNVQTIKNYIYSIPQWKKKLEKPYFSDDEIQKAIDESKRLFGNK